MYKLLRHINMSTPAAQLLNAPQNNGKKPYDPELIYVECRVCGRPVLWESGRTTTILAESQINPSDVDEHCLILSEGCHECKPETGNYHLSIVRLANMPLSALMLMQKPKGHA